VAAPLDWEELGDAKLHPQRYTVKNVFRRLSQKADPWEDLFRRGQSLTEARRRLEEMGG
jgi:bifunctional non-homologous end joining protein LigD